MVDAGVPPIALADWENGGAPVAAADCSSGPVRPEPPVPVERLIFRGVTAGVKPGGDRVIQWEPRPGGRDCAFVYDTTVVTRVPAGAGREDARLRVVVPLDSVGKGQSGECRRAGR